MPPWPRIINKIYLGNQSCLGGLRVRRGTRATSPRRESVGDECLVVEVVILEIFLERRVAWDQRRDQLALFPPGG
jgi:hypothetical protein